MNKLTLMVLPALFFCGCSHIPKKDTTIYSSPLVSGVSEKLSSAKSSIIRASSNADKLAALLQQNTEAWNAFTKVKADLVESSKNLADVETQLAEYVAKVANQTEILNKAVEDKNTAISEAHKEQDKRIIQEKLAWKWRLLFLTENSLILIALAGIVAVKLGVKIPFLP